MLLQMPHGRFLLPELHKLGYPIEEIRIFREYLYAILGKYTHKAVGSACKECEAHERMDTHSVLAKTSLIKEEEHHHGGEARKECKIAYVARKKSRALSIKYA